MKFITIVRFLFLSTFVFASSARASDYTVLVMGDSISAAYGLDEKDGWVRLAEQQLEEDGFAVEFINASISGETTVGGLRNLSSAMERFNPDLLIIELGGNDGLRGYPPNSIAKNLESMALLAKEQGTNTLILGMMIPTNYGQAYLKLLAKSFVTAAENSDSQLLPFFLEPIARDKDRSYFQTDGIHPTAAAQPILMHYVLPLIKENLPNEHRESATN